MSLFQAISESKLERLDSSVSNDDLYCQIVISFFSVSHIRDRHVVFLRESPSQTNTLHGLSPRANYTDRSTAACRRSDCQILRTEGATWSA
jgi:hypothetical protein